MGNYLEWKYIQLLSSQLQNYKTKSNRLINMSCPFCRETETSHKKHPARGYVFDAGEHFNYYCHRCGESMTAPTFIKRLDTNLYADYMKEKLKDRGYSSGVEHRPSKSSVESSNLSARSPNKVMDHALRTVQKISRLPKDHFARRYVESRLIPEECQKSLYFTPKFMTWVNTIIPDKFSEEALKYDEPRLIIPFFSRNGHRLVAVQGRSFVPVNNRIKYMTIAIDRSVPVIYGMDKYNSFQMGFVTEGPLDAMFLRNAIATAGGEMVGKLEGFEKDKLTLVYDNEPRKPETIQKMEKAIGAGFSVAVWPNDFKYKDVNEAVMAGMRPEEIEDLLLEHAFSGISAEFELKQWRKV
jgi:hypothetical protein